MATRTPASRHDLATLWVLAALALLLAACGGGDETPSATSDDAATPDVAADDDEAPDVAADGGAAAGCDLVSASDVEAATGFTVLDQVEFGGGCTWTVEPVDDDVIEAAISWQPWSLENFEGQRQADQAGMDVTEVSGLGDEAFIVSQDAGDHPVGEVWVRVDGQAFRITNQFATARYADALEVQQSLAAVVADALR